MAFARIDLGGVDVYVIPSKARNPNTSRGCFRLRFFTPLRSVQNDMTGSSSYVVGGWFFAADWVLVGLSFGAVAGGDGLLFLHLRAGVQTLVASAFRPADTVATGSVSTWPPPV